MTRSKLAGGERELLGVGFLEPDRDIARSPALRCASAIIAGAKSTAGEAMATRHQLEGEEAGAAADVERVARP